MTEKEELIDKSKKIVMSAFDNEPIYMYEEPTPEIIKDMIKLGFSDVFNNPNSAKSKKYYGIIKDFLNTYCFRK